MMWQTPRLNIRRLRTEDWADLHALQGDPEATTFIGGVWTPERTQEAINRIVAGYESKELEWFAVADRVNDQVLGVCWLGQLNLKWCGALGWGEEIELGYRYARQHWNKGYATEAGRAMLRRGFEELGFESVVAIVDVRNLASERVMHKLGMRLEATGTHDGLTILGYRINRDEHGAKSGDAAGGSIRTFGKRSDDANYILRPGGYAIIARAPGEIAVAVTARGWFLPGGGQEREETAAQAAVREAREECGLRIRVVGQVGVADELVYSAEDGCFYRKRCCFFRAEPVDATQVKGEDGHQLVWATPAQVRAQLAHESQRWAVGICCTSGDGTGQA